jgi:hypothetical protein
MKEYQSIGVMSTPQTPIRQDSKDENPIRRRHHKGSRSGKSTSQKWSQLMKEYKYVEVTTFVMIHRMRHREDGRGLKGGGPGR